VSAPLAGIFQSAFVVVAGSLSAHERGAVLKLATREMGCRLAAAAPTRPHPSRSNKSIIMDWDNHCDRARRRRGRSADGGQPSRATSWGAASAGRKGLRAAALHWVGSGDTRTHSGRRRRRPIFELKTRPAACARSQMSFPAGGLEHESLPTGRREREARFITYRRWAGCGVAGRRRPKRGGGAPEHERASQAEKSGDATNKMGQTCPTA
jgi:hypothetical protein